MKTFAIFLLVLVAAASVVAAEEASPALPMPATLEQQLDALDRTDAELEQLKAQLSAAATPAERQSLEARCRTIEAFQAALLQAIEQAVGPLPAGPATTAPAAPHSALERQLEQQRQKDETLLDRPVIRD